MRARLLPALVVAVALEATALIVMELQAERQAQRIAVLSRELYAIPDPLKAIDNPRGHENAIEDLQQGLADLAQRRGEK